MSISKLTPEEIDALEQLKELYNNDIVDGIERKVRGTGRGIKKSDLMLLIAYTIKYVLELQLSKGDDYDMSEEFMTDIYNEWKTKLG